MTELISARYFNAGQDPSARGPVCAICDMRHAADTEFCQRCFAPMELSHSVRARRTAPRFLAVLGASGVGKTVYLGLLLDILTKGYRDLRGLPHGAFSISLQHDVILALEQQRFPDKTPSEPDRWQWVHCVISRETRRKTVLDLVTPDLAGEVLATEVDHPRTNQTIATLIHRCSGLVLLIDAPRVRDEGRHQDLFAMKLVSYLDRQAGRRRRGKVDLPVAIVFSKADLCEECAADPEGFARSNVPGLWQLCQGKLGQYRFFASSVAGAVATLQDDEGRAGMIPLRIEPRGIIEPFAWMFDLEAKT